MAQISDNINLELTTTEITLNSSTPGDGFIYSAIPLLDSIDDASQLEIYWNVKYVKRVDDSVKIDVDTLAADVRAQLRLLDGSLWQVDNDTKELFITSDLVNREVTAGGVAYMYGPDAGLGIDAPAVADNQYIEIRRATSLDNRLVTFQPGTRLTSANLNISNEQMFNALQEITKYGIFAIGGSETAGKPDISENSITELRDVATFTSAGFLQWNGTEVISLPLSTGNFVPVTNTGAAEGEALVVTNTSSLGGYSWERLIAADINRRSGNSENLDSYLSTQSGLVQGIDSRTGTLESNIVTLEAEIDTIETREQTWLASPPLTSIETTAISGAGYRSLFDPTDLTNTITYSGTLASIIDTTANDAGLVADRDLTLRVTLSGAANPPANTSSSTGVYVWPHIDGTQAGNALYSYRDSPDQLSQSHMTWVLTLLAGEKLDLRVFKNQDSTDNSFLTYASLFIEELNSV